MSSVYLLPAVSKTLLDILRRRDVPSVGGCLRWAIRDELSRCSNHVDELSTVHRDYACDLLDWYIAAYGENSVLDSWLRLYRSDAEELIRVSDSLLDWFSAHFSELTFRRKVQVIDFADWFFEMYGYSKPDWRAIYQ